MMKRNYLWALFALLVIGGLLVAEPIEESVFYQGTLLQVSGIWFIKTADNMLGLEIGALQNEAGELAELAAGDTVTVSGKLKETTLVVNQLSKDKETYAILESADEQSDYKGYQVDTYRCIGCRLCVKNCPVCAISMQKGKAVIDVNKCIQCGICVNGDGKSWKGCPVGAIGNISK